ncbi:hypothetical protein FA95DRAFT_1561384 [Auriscalpium vulgare]|uniref:Uncharacterized protein n=1 Tax=Auriscalpium vulgare TaxID=40419 RepID=A0ACB8RML9_9AGAM|nr:hypothetical protein FA95DRAFT_1561384 [Auriscalpium vulgare]
MPHDAIHAAARRGHLRDHADDPSQQRQALFQARSEGPQSHYKTNISVATATEIHITLSSRAKLLLLTPSSQLEHHTIETARPMNSPILVWMLYLNREVTTEVRPPP